MTPANSPFIEKYRDNDMLQTSIDMLRNSSTEFSTIKDSCLYAHVSTAINGSLGMPDSDPMKVQGTVFCLVTKGRLHAEVNTRQINIDAPAIVSLHSGTVVELEPAANQGGAEAYLLIFTPTFLRDINISFSAISGEAFIEHDKPMVELNDEQTNLIIRYFSIIHSVMSDPFNEQINKHIISSITSAIFYQMVSFLYKSLDYGVKDRVGSRRDSYVEDFMRLVHANYTQERSVSYYAERLFISPKYLSLLVKEATGRSAARWIDFFVIQEAKNLLRYSGKNVQQVAYALNFSNQSSFGKYFKHLVGVSPTEYQKGE